MKVIHKLYLWIMPFNPPREHAIWIPHTFSYNTDLQVTYSHSTILTEMTTNLVNVKNLGRVIFYQHMYYLVGMLAVNPYRINTNHTKLRPYGWWLNVCPWYISPRYFTYYTILSGYVVHLVHIWYTHLYCKLQAKLYWSYEPRRNIWVFNTNRSQIPTDKYSSREFG